MRIKANLQNKLTGRHESVNLPVSQDKLRQILDLIGVNYLMTGWKSSFENVRCDITYTVDEYYGDLNTVNIIDDEDFIMVNLLAMALDALDDYEIDKIKAYTFNVADICNCTELINVIMQHDDINFYYYEHDNGSLYENFGKTIVYQVDDPPSDFWCDYIDWDAYGRYMENDFYLGDYGFLDKAYPGDIDMSYYDFDEICDNYCWDLDCQDEENQGICLHINVNTLFDFLGGV